ncbi:MAG: hypothetical protein EOS22_04805 [Mesorhizobium sp.]|uniref:hypothetical protein n=1 Tax=Mesorhizobium sp. TaxID=1871066 RepID=UPI000FE78BBD|nr:hypothetical protein [Mesorhizobium sp.]RWD31343.1 MAG: hypothetical protein EOS22_04805 [Mesorhizobium sp.]TJW70743.1 MAG: hypothetical protein E5V29_03260 [Mesorhizobium sp.]
MKPDTQRQFDEEMRVAGWCAGFAAPNALQLLIERGIKVDQFQVLFDCLGSVGRSWDFRDSKQMLDAESQIVVRAKELIALLRRAEHDNGWRHVWDSDYETIESSVEIEQLVDELKILAQSTSQQLVQIGDMRYISLRPQSGKVRYFYWISLIAFWQFVLSRDVKASDNGIGKASGPLVAFVTIMSERMDGPAITPGAIRKFIERHRGDIDKFARRFLPSQLVTLHYFAGGRLPAKKI